jgi:hypothetical protein
LNGGSLTHTATLAANAATGTRARSSMTNRATSDGRRSAARSHGEGSLTAGDRPGIGPGIPIASPSLPLRNRRRQRSR